MGDISDVDQSGGGALVSTLGAPQKKQRDDDADKTCKHFLVEIRSGGRSGASLGAQASDAVEQSRLRSRFDANAGREGGAFWCMSGRARPYRHAGVPAWSGTRLQSL